MTVVVKAMTSEGSGGGFCWFWKTMMAAAEKGAAGMVVEFEYPNNCSTISYTVLLLSWSHCRGDMSATTTHGNLAIPVNALSHNARPDSHLGNEPFISTDLNQDPITLIQHRTRDPYRCSGSAMVGHEPLWRSNVWPTCFSLGDNPEEEPISDPNGLNYKYYDRLHGWRSEKRQCGNRTCDMAMQIKVVLVDFVLPDDGTGTAMGSSDGGRI
ncbi:hypothetical protein HAX54_039407 [Datura stramonium]|uniref:Uncharacterized protein n=1 Tax=Datura stramonium TaxID=4076 RepID=A0ABS8VN02_DATST|nr:hypothetical protein [Datura stramonium]